MPKAITDTEKDKDKLKKTKSSTSKTTTVSKKKTSSKSSTKSTSTTKKNSTKKTVSSETKKKSKSTTQNSTSSSTKKSTTTRKKTSSTRKNTTTKKKVDSKQIETNIVAEYYDLPYRYNETLVKILYQTPTILFVYWDVADYDRENLIKKYGENFFNNTKPILKIYNLTKNYNFEVEINDFANSWYINVNDANCEYKVELIRRTIKFEENSDKDYVYISTSNNIEFPNDRILLDTLPNTINFKNIKTNEITQKNISTMHLIGINRIHNVHHFYKKFYKDELLEDLNKKHIIHTSSSSL